MTERHYPAESIAALAEGKLPRSEIAAALAHFDRCPACTAELEVARELAGEPAAAAPRRAWMAIAAAVLIAVAGAPFAWRALHPAPLARLIALAPTAARSIEPRLAGGFAWAPFAGAVRGDDDANPARMKLLGVAGELVERADARPTPASQHAAGVGLLLANQPEVAIARLRAAADGAPDDAHGWSDLAAAEYTAALRLGRASLYPVALEHADHALRIDPRCPEALFNRALILQRLGLTAAARDAWNAYLKIDPSSSWARDARDRLKAATGTTGDSEFRHDQPRLERAAVDGDSEIVAAICNRHRQQCRTWSEAEYLGRWAEAEQHRDVAQAARPLAVAHAVGDALLAFSGESLLHDAVAAIDRAPPARRAALADAQASYRRGRLAYSRGQPAAAEPDLRRAAAGFAGADSPMTLMARYYAASTRFDQNDAAGARRELEVLRGEADQSPGYIALGAHLRWQLALCTTLDDDWDATANLTAVAARAFDNLGETSSAAFMRTLRATALISMGRPDEGWALRAQAFAAQSAEGRGDRLLVSIGDAVFVELRSGRLEAARALLGVEKAAYRSAGNAAQLSNTLVREALIGGAQHDARAASASVREAMEAAQRIGDPALRSRAVADVRFAAAGGMLATDAPRARDLLTQAIDAYAATGASLYLPEAHLLRARASLRMGDRDAAQRDLTSGMQVADRHASGSGVIDARRALFEQSIALRLDGGSITGAFAEAERERGGPAASLAALQGKLAGSDAAVIQLVLLPRELVAFCVTAREASIARREIDRETVGALASRGDDVALRELYDLLIRPAEAQLARAGSLIVVADPRLQRVPFAALIDARTGRPLIQRFSVAMAMSASALQPSRQSKALRSIVTVALPSGEGNGTVALPEQEAEVAEVGGFYARATRTVATFSALSEAAARADVIHIAGHTARQPGGDDAALLFRRGPAELEPVTWSRIAALKLAQPVVVLAACDTLRMPVFPLLRGSSLGGGFLAAGASSVIGTLAPIPDDQARAIFRSIHRELSRGRGAAEAVRQAVIQSIAGESSGRISAWRSVALLTTRIERS
jgi:tetratricopeptide (TPR) repeat protein